MAQKFFSVIFLVALMVAGCFGNAQTDARAGLCNDYLDVADKKNNPKTLSDEIRHLYRNPPFKHAIHFFRICDRYLYDER